MGPQVPRNATVLQCWLGGRTSVGNVCMLSAWFPTSCLSTENKSLLFETPRLVAACFEAHVPVCVLYNKMTLLIKCQPSGKKASNHSVHALSHCHTELVAGGTGLSIICSVHKSCHLLWFFWLGKLRPGQKQWQGRLFATWDREAWPDGRATPGLILVGQLLSLSPPPPASAHES